MANFELRLTNLNCQPHWEWEVIQCDTVSDIETLIEGGCDPTSEQALGKAKAALLTARSKHANDQRDIQELR